MVTPMNDKTIWDGNSVLKAYEYDENYNIFKEGRKNFTTSIFYERDYMIFMR